MSSTGQKRETWLTWAGPGSRWWEWKGSVCDRQSQAAADVSGSQEGCVT